MCNALISALTAFAILSFNGFMKLCIIFRSDRRLVKMTGSFRSLRGINATGPVGVGETFAAEAFGGGDTGRVADCGRVSVFFSLFVGFGDAVLTVLAPLFVTMALSLPALNPVKTALGAAGTSGFMLKVSSFMLSLSLRRFATGSLSNVLLVAEADVVICALIASWLKMQ